VVDSEGNQQLVNKHRLRKHLQPDKTEQQLTDHDVLQQELEFINRQINKLQADKVNKQEQLLLTDAQSDAQAAAATPATSPSEINQNSYCVHIGYPTSSQ